MKLTITKPGKINNIANCRTIFLSLFTLFISVASLAQPHLSLAHKDHKEISITGEYKHIEVWGNVTVVLTDAPAREILLEGNSKNFNLVKTRVNDGKLEIDAVKKKSLSKLIIYVPVNEARSVIVNGDAEILGAIRTDDLKILLNGESTLRVRYFGKLKVEPGDGYEMVDGRRNKY
jgi:Putative auto-transporter adhesin, head GIN domain